MGGGVMVPQLGTHNASGREVAIKKFRKDDLKEEDLIRLRREIQFIRQFRHPHPPRLARV